MLDQIGRAQNPITADRLNLIVENIVRFLRSVVNSNYQMKDHIIDPGTGPHTGVLTEPYGGTNQSTYTTGDILYSDTANSLEKLPVGTTGQVLTVTAGVPVWAGPGASLLIDRLITTGTSGSALSALRAVRYDNTGRLVVADNSEVAMPEAVMGMTITSAGSAGVSVQVLTEGEYAEATWTWTINGPIFMGSSGVLTQTSPTTGYTKILAVAVTATKIYWHKQSAFVL